MELAALKFNSHVKENREGQNQKTSPTATPIATVAKEAFENRSTATTASPTKTAAPPTSSTSEASKGKEAPRFRFINQAEDYGDGIRINVPNSPRIFIFVDQSTTCSQLVTDFRAAVLSGGTSIPAPLRGVISFKLTLAGKDLMNPEYANMRVSDLFIRGDNREFHLINISRTPTVPTSTTST